MTFSTRNVYHLRLSAHSLLPLYLYLDERHVGWMTDATFQQVLADLRPLLIPQLREHNTVRPLISQTASASKKPAIEIHHADDYKFAFFFRKTEPHSVIIKSRTFVAAPREPSLKNQSQSPTHLGKRKRPLSPREIERVNNELPKKTRHLRERPIVERSYVDFRRNSDEDSEVNADNATDDQDYEPDESTASVKQEGSSALLLAGGTPSTAEKPIEIEVDDLDEKPKLALRMKYQGFSVAARCLCLIIEPRNRNQFRVGPPTANLFLRSRRAHTPLFINDDDHDEDHSNANALVENHDEDALASERLYTMDDNDFSIDMLQLSQILQDTGSGQGGGEDDAESDGAVFAGDAEEAPISF